MNKEKILCAAIDFKGTIVCGFRHSDCYKILTGLLTTLPEVEYPIREHQGFLTSHNRFVNRAEGFIIAKANNQIIHKMFDENDEGILTSEDLY